MTASGVELEDVTVVVPSYNHAAYVEACLRSIFAQTHRPAKLLVVDDGSKDGSPAIIEATLKDAPFPAELVVQKNRGLCATLNHALSFARTPLFAYLGSDDTWEPERLALGAQALAASPSAVLAYGHAYVIDARGERTGSTTDWGHYRAGSIFWDLMRGESIPLSPTPLHRRALLERFGWEERSRLEDYELYLKLAWHGPFAFVPQHLGSWRSHGANTSRQLDMMLGAILAAHGRLAAELPLDPRELARASAAVRFRFADYYLTSGARLRATELTLQGARGAPSARALLRRTARLLSPQRLLAWRASQLEARARTRFSTDDGARGARRER